MILSWDVFDKNFFPPNSWQLVNQVLENIINFDQDLLSQLVIDELKMIKVEKKHELGP